MAMFTFEASSGEPGDQYRTWMGPRAARTAVDSILSMIWMMLPVGERTLMALESQARVAFAEAADEWRAMDAEQRMQALNPATSPTVGGEADVVIPDAEAPPPPEAATADAQTNLLLSDLAKMLGPDYARLAFHRSLLATSVLLPPARRSDAEVERVVRALLDSALAQWWDDARTFDFPTG